MKQRLSPLAVSLCLLGLVSIPVHAATTDQAADAKKLQTLEQEVAQLQHQVSVLEGQHKHVGRRPSSKRHVATTDTVTSTEHGAESTSSSSAAPILGQSNLPTSGGKYLPVDVDVPGQSFVSSGPYLGIPLEFSGSNLIINSPSVNQDVALLKVRKNIHNRLKQYGIVEESEHSHVLLSGIIEGQAIYNHPGSGPTSSDIDLTSAGLDAYVLGPSWISGMISLAYDNNPGTNTGSFNNFSRTQDSRVYIKQAFVTIGDLNKSPVYGSFGQFYVPFGTYSSSMVSSPLTQSVARVKARSILVGYQPQTTDAVYASTYIFRGDSYAGSTNRVNNGGINLGYHFASGKFSGDFGGGAIANIADSQGMQNNGNNVPYFGGFGASGSNGSGFGNEHIIHRVPAYDIRGMFDFGNKFDFIGEYIIASTHFNPTDLSMNAHGAKPQALHTEAVYTFTWIRPNSIAIGYDMTKDALALGVPAQRYSMTFNTSVWRNTLQSLELRHDVNYAASAMASGSNVAAIQESGKADNVVTAQFDFYF